MAGRTVTTGAFQPIFGLNTTPQSVTINLDAIGKAGVGIASPEKTSAFSFGSETSMLGQTPGLLTNEKQKNKAAMFIDPRFNNLVDEIVKNQPNLDSPMEYIGQFLTNKTTVVGTGGELPLTLNKNSFNIFRELQDQYDVGTGEFVDAVRTELELRKMRGWASSDAWQGVIKPAQAVGSVISTFLRPIALGQDALFALTTDITDKQPGMQNLSKMQWQKYFNFNPNNPPERPVSGEQMLRSVLGEQQEGLGNDFFRTAGAIADLVADPALAGAAIRTLGKLGKAAGLSARAAQAVISTGDKVEYIFSPYKVAMDGTRKTANLLTRGNAERMVGKMLNGILNANVPLPTKLTAGREYTVSSFTGIPNPFDTLGNEVRGVVETAQLNSYAAKDDLFTGINSNMEKIEKALGREPAKNWLQNMMNASARGAKTTAKFSIYPDEVARALNGLVVDVADNVGAALNPNAVNILKEVESTNRTVNGLGVTAASIGDEIGSLSQYFTKAGQQAGLINPRGTLDPILSNPIYREASKKVRSLARQYDLDPQILDQQFREAVDNTMASETLIGYHASLYEPVKESVMARVLELGQTEDVARAIWDSMMSAGMTGQELKTVKGISRPGIGLRSFNQLFGDDITDASKLFDGTQLAANLDINTFMNGLVNGHLRRVYAPMWGNAASASAYGNAVRSGEVIPSKIIDDYDIGPALYAKGYQAETKLVDNYIKNLAPTIPGSRGVVISQDGLVRYLHSKGVAPERIRETIGTIIGTIRPGLDQMYGEITKYASGKANEGFRGSRDVVQPRTVEDVAFMEQLGIMSDPIYSVAESTNVTLKNMTHRNVLAELWKYATRESSDLALDTKAYDSLTIEQRAAYVEMKGSVDAYGPFAGKWVNKTMAREINNSLADTTARSGLLARFGSVIRAGWLANPATTAANTAGGFYLAALHGYNPVELFKNVVEVGRDWAKMGDDLPEIRATRGLLFSTAKHNDLVQKMRFDKLSAMDVNQQNFFQKLNGFYDAYTGWLEQPLGKFNSNNLLAKAYNSVSGLVGLKAFETSENLFKLSAYRMGIKEGLSHAEALDKAKNIVFNYANQPGYVRMMRDTGVKAFPGFSHFIIGRQLNALINRPGSLAFWDNLDDAIWQAATPDEETKNALQASLADWERQGKYIPIRRQGGEGRYTWSFIPLESIFPTQNLSGKGFQQMLMDFGLYNGAVDLVSAAFKNGEGLVSSQYGREVFQSSEGVAGKIAQTGKFLYDQYAPALPKQIWSFGAADSDGEGLLSLALPKDEYRMPGFEQSAYTHAELTRGRADKDAWDHAIGLLLRRTRQITLDPNIATIMKRKAGEESELQQRLGNLNARIKKANEQGNQQEAARLWAQAQTEQLRFNEKWRPLIGMYDKFLESKNLGGQ